MKLSTLQYDRAKQDFLVNGKSLLEHLHRHEAVVPEMHLISILSQPDSCNRLLGRSDPDLQDGHVSIYLCSHCGGYDGNPIGLELVITDSTVTWKNLGYYQDYDGEPAQLFSKVREYSFDLIQYQDLLEKLKIYEP